MNKATLGTLLALTALVSVTGCAKKESATPAASPASPASPMAGMQPGQPHPAPTAGEAANVDLIGGGAYTRERRIGESPRRPARFRAGPRRLPVPS